MPAPKYTPRRVVLLDLDALRPDVFQHALQDGRLPNLGRLVGGPGLSQAVQLEILSTVPSITYCSQATCFTGSHPRQHGIVGNQFFDRFGRFNNGTPRAYAFDFTDAPYVYRGLAGETLAPGVETIYESAARRGLRSTVAFGMYARGAEHWLRPGLDDWASFVSLQPKRGVSERLDDAMLDDVLEHLRAGNRPDVLTLYFWGLDHESHIEGPHIQYEYLSQVIDRQVGRFLEAYEAAGLLPDTLFVVFSDHGQIPVIKDERHALKAGVLFDRELSYIFQALDLDLRDLPGESEYDAVLTINGGMVHVYVRQPGQAWDAPPRYQEDVLRLAQAFWQANQNGALAPELQGALDLVLVRDAAGGGWDAPYRAYTPQGVLPVEEYLALHPEVETAAAASRLGDLACPASGDLLLFSNYRDGFYFLALSYAGMHGGLHPQDSNALLVYALPGGAPAQVNWLRRRLRKVIGDRCQAEGGRPAGIADLAHGLRAVMGWL